MVHCDFSLFEHWLIGAGYVHVGLFEAGEEVAFADQFVGGCFVFLQVVLEGLVEARDRVARVAGLHRHGGVRRERNVAACQPGQGKFGASRGARRFHGVKVARGTAVSGGSTVLSAKSLLSAFTAGAKAPYKWSEDSGCRSTIRSLSQREP